MATRAKAKLGSLGDDFFPGISTFDPSTVNTFDPSTFDASNLLDTSAIDPGGFDFSSSFNPIQTLTPDIASIASPDLINISIDNSGFTLPSFQTDNTGSSIFDALSSGLSSVGSWLTSAAGLSAVGNITNTVLKANTPQQQTVQTQVARVASGNNPAPITYGYNTAGQVVPILQTGVNQGQALNPTTLASFLPSSLKQYATPISLGVLALIAVSLMRQRREG